MCSKVPSYQFRRYKEHNWSPQSRTHFQNLLHQSKPHVIGWVAINVNKRLWQGCSLCSAANEQQETGTHPVQAAGMRPRLGICVAPSLHHSTMINAQRPRAWQEGAHNKPANSRQQQYHIPAPAAPQLHGVLTGLLCCPHVRHAAAWPAPRCSCCPSPAQAWHRAGRGGSPQVWLFGCVAGCGISSFVVTKVLCPGNCSHTQLSVQLNACT